jgi:glucose/arabinose dehydrogenase
MCIKNQPEKFNIFLLKFIFTFLSFFCFSRLTAQDFPFVEFNLYAQGLQSPVDVIGSPFGNSDLYVVQRGTTSGSAQIKVVSTGTLLATPFLTVTGISCCGERGLLSMVFHPDVQTNGTFYVFYTASGSGDLTIARYKLKSTGNFYEADPDSRQVILSIPHPTNSNHNGGKLLFGPDGYLYLGTGDGGSSNDPPGNAQNPQSLLGKILRINPSVNSTVAPHYTIPADNPFAASGDGIADEIFAFGMRNPWRWSFDRTTGNAWIADVGQNNWEELNRVSPASLKGANFGWRCFEGNATNNASGIQPCTLYNGQPHLQPGYVYPHNNTSGGFSVTGGYVYRGAVYPKLQGLYLMADYVSGALWMVKTDGSFAALRQTTGVPANISGFGESGAAEMWAVSLTEGKVYSIKAEGTLSAELVTLSGKTMGTNHLLEWEVLAGNGNEKYAVEAADITPGSLFKTISTISSRGTGRQSYSYATFNAAQAMYRIKTSSTTTPDFYSKSIILGNPVNLNGPQITRRGNQWLIQVPEGTRYIRLSDINGRLLYAASVGLNSRNLLVNNPATGVRMVIIQTTGKEGNRTAKFWVP